MCVIGDTHSTHSIVHKDETTYECINYFDRKGMLYGENSEGQGQRNEERVKNEDGESGVDFVSFQP